MNTAELLALLKNNDRTLDAEVVLYAPGIGSFTVSDAIGRGEKELVLIVAPHV